MVSSQTIRPSDYQTFGLSTQNPIEYVTYLERGLVSLMPLHFGGRV